jgi:hypothetical protein
MRHLARFRALAVVGLLFASFGSLGAHERTGTVRVLVSPDRDDWTYEPGAAVSFRIAVTRDGHPLPGVRVSYSYGPEMLPLNEAHGPVEARPPATSGQFERRRRVRPPVA